MLYVVLAFLWVSILLYILMGGADFGAGIIELFTRKINRSRTHRTMYKAIGPIWEANHMWLIIAIVILFVGFPAIYSNLSIYLHIPLTAMLLGIVARGTAFSFRHYDAVKDEMQVIYRRTFMYASCITPFFLGIIAGSTVSKNIDNSSNDFLTAYIFSWLHAFPLTVGIFTVSICGFLAAVYLVGETNDTEDQVRFISKVRTANIAAVASGIFVFTAASLEHIPLFSWAFENPVGLLCVGSASLSLILFWILIKKGKRIILRPLAGFQVTMILVMVTYNNFPAIVEFKNGTTLSFLANSAPPQTIFVLGWALVLGSILILPGLFYLVYNFQLKKIQVEDEI